MKITLNPDKEIVKAVKEGLKKTGGYCPCRLERTVDTKCMCKEFKEQIANPDFEGFCHCFLYLQGKVIKIGHDKLYCRKCLYKFYKSILVKVVIYIDKN